MNFTIKKSDLIYKGKVFDIKVDKIEYNSGNEANREVVVHPGGAVVVGVTRENKIVMVKQHRYPMNKILIELPAGKLDKDEDPQMCAARELEEETGYRSNKMENLVAYLQRPVIHRKNFTFLLHWIWLKAIITVKKVRKRWSC